MDIWISGTLLPGFCLIVRVHGLEYFIFQAGKRVCFISLRAAICILFLCSLVCLTITLLIPGFAAFDYIINLVVLWGDIFVYMYGNYGLICLKCLFSAVLLG